jgi:hypothetical protein
LLNCANGFCRKPCPSSVKMRLLLLIRESEFRSPWFFQIFTHRREAFQRIVSTIANSDRESYKLATP